MTGRVRGFGNGAGWGHHANPRFCISFSNAISVAAGTSLYFGFSRPAVTGTINTLGAVSFGAEVLACGPGLIRGARLRQTNAGLVPLAFDLFVEISVGGGAFVRTVLANTGAVASGTCVGPALARVRFADCNRFRAGLVRTTGGGAIIVNPLQVTLDIEYTPPS
jgi:hypothetical protein